MKTKPNTYIVKRRSVCLCCPCCECDCSAHLSEANTEVYDIETEDLARSEVERLFGECKTSFEDDEIEITVWKVGPRGGMTEQHELGKHTY